MDGIAPEALNRIQKLLNHKCKFSDHELFNLEYDQEIPLVRKWVDALYARLVAEKKIDVPELPPAKKHPSSVHDWQTIDLKSLRHKDVREISSEWICYQVIK